MQHRSDQLVTRKEKKTLKTSKNTQKQKTQTNENKTEKVISFTGKEFNYGRLQSKRGTSA